MKNKLFLVSIFLFVTGGSLGLEMLPSILRANLPPPAIHSNAWLLVDYNSNWVLGEHNARQRIGPASLTKLMTSYLVFEALKNKKLKLTDKVYVSKKAWKMGGSRMFIKVDTHVYVEDLVQGMVVQSGNDAAVALAEHLGGTEQNFALKMNHKAAELGMTDTHFTNSSGLPDSDHYSTLYDMTILSATLIKNFPVLYKYYAQKEFTYNKITQKNRNLLLWRNLNVDGIKTGYIKSAGYSLIATAQRDDMRLIAAVTGSMSKRQRADQAQSLLQYGFSTYDSIILFKPDTVVKVLPLFMGQSNTAETILNRTLGLAFPKGKKENFSAALDLPKWLQAPLKYHQEVGTMNVKYKGETVLHIPLHSRYQYNEGPWWSRLLDSARKLLY